MTDRTSVKAAVAAMLGCGEEELAAYDNLIEQCCLSAQERLTDSAYENDARIINFAAAKCYYRILLLNQSENVTSFKAGDISYTVSSAAVDGARELYLSAAEDCKGIIADGSFAFKAV